MQKLGKQYYYTRNGEKKINCYKINLSRDLIKKAGIGENDILKVYTKNNKIIIEKSDSNDV